MLVALVAYKFLKHSKCKSKCFGNESSLDVDLSETKLDEKFNISRSSVDSLYIPPSPRPTIFV
jgi:malate/lactate dehydrogenase